MRHRGAKVFDLRSAMAATTLVDGRSVLAIDLDRTLLRTDTLYESFWQNFADNWQTPWVALTGLVRGRANLKRRLAQMGAMDVESLPYNEVVLNIVRCWRENGGHTVLVSAANQLVAERVSTHLGLFDTVLSSDGSVNLIGKVKAARLASVYGERGFIYVGDSLSDLPVWEIAAGAITVDSSHSLRDRVDQMHPNALHIGASGGTAQAALHAIRPHQWLKNLLVFLPMLASHRIETNIALQSLLTFLAFCLVASGGYVFNDLLDLKADRLHIRKRERPFASGAMPIAYGTWLWIALVIGGFSAAAPLGLHLLLLLLGYLLLTTAYSMKIKRGIVIDICALALLYTSRILAGALSNSIPISAWLLAFSIFFFFALAAVKRQVELVGGIAAGAVQATGRGYQKRDLPIVAQMASSAGHISILILALYITSEAITRLYPRPEVLWGLCLILLFWLNRMTLLANRGEMQDDPVVFAVVDRTSQLCILVAGLLILVGALPG